jgi:hypothetical protein
MIGVIKLVDVFTRLFCNKRFQGRRWLSTELYLFERAKNLVKNDLDLTSLMRVIYDV